MRRLARKTLYTQDVSLDTRVESLERRIIPSPELPFCYATANYLGETLTTGHFVNMGLESVSTNDPLVYAHLPLVDGWVEDDTNNIDGCIAILQPGLYDMFVTMSGFQSVPSATQNIDMQIRTIEITDPKGTPTPSGIWLAAMNVGTHGSPPSLAFGVDIIGGSDWAMIRLAIGGLSTFEVKGVKPYLALQGAGSNLNGVTLTMMVIQLCTLECDVGTTNITDGGIPAAWDDPCS